MAVLSNNDTVRNETRVGDLCLGPQHATGDDGATFLLAYTEYNLGSQPVESPWTNHWFWDGQLIAVDQRCVCTKYRGSAQKSERSDSALLRFRVGSSSTIRYWVRTKLRNT
jgi:hypothetical protein